jgi:flagellar hook-associated protein FlgK
MAVSITDPQKIASSVDTFEINSSNNTIEFNVGGPSLFATISQGTYTAAELAAALKSALEAADGVANTYTVVYNPIIKRFKLINDAGGASTINLLWTAGGTTAEQIFGFTADSSIAVGSYDVSDNSVSSYAANALPGDNRNAKTIADLINQTVIAGSTPVDFYRSMVSDVGVEALSAKQSLKFQDALVDELERRRQEFSGVSLDEEAANLIKYQKMFEASAKMISVADELLSILMNMTGRR